MNTHIRVKNWKELVQKVEGLDKSRFTLVLDGWINKVGRKEIKLQKLIFRICDNKILAQIAEDNGNLSNNEKEKPKSLYSSLT